MFFSVYRWNIPYFRSRVKHRLSTLAEKNRRSAYHFLWFKGFFFFDTTTPLTWNLAVLQCEGNKFRPTANSYYFSKRARYVTVVCAASLIKSLCKVGNRTEHCGITGLLPRIPSSPYRLHIGQHSGLQFTTFICYLHHATHNLTGDRGSTVVKVLCYKSEGRWFDPSWCQWIFHWHKIL